MLDEQVRLVIAENLGESIDAISPEAKVIDDLGADSLDSVEIIMALEDKFDIEITDDEAIKVVTVQDAIDLVKKKCPASLQQSA